MPNTNSYKRTNQIGNCRNSEYNETPSERCSSGKASIIPSCNDIEKNAVQTPCITRAKKYPSNPVKSYKINAIALIIKMMRNTLTANTQ